jgi:hypothetical protein
MKPGRLYHCNGTVIFVLSVHPTASHSDIIDDDAFATVFELRRPWQVKQWCVRLRYWHEVKL